MPNMAALGAMGGFGRGLSNLAPMYMRLQERKQDLALRQQELEKEQQEKDMQRRMDMLRMSIVSKNPEFIKQALSNLGGHFSKQEDGIDFSEIDFSDHEVEAARELDAAFTQYGKDKNLDRLYKTFQGVLAQYPRSESYLDAQKARLAAIEKRQGLEESQFRQAQLRGDIQEVPQTGMTYGLGEPPRPSFTTTGRQGQTRQFVRKAEEPEQAYIIGQRITEKVGDEWVTKTVTGFDESGLPTFREESRAPRYKPPGVTVNVGAERLGIQKEKDAAEIRTNLIKTEKDNRDYFDTNAHFFNDFNKQNEVAYWDSGLSAGKQKGQRGAWRYDEQVKIFKLTPKLIRDGWTSKKIQERARRTGMTIEEILERIGAL